MSFARIILMAVIFLVAVYPPISWAEDEIPKEIISIFPKDFPPYYMTNEKGNPSGFAIEVLDTLALRAGLNIHHSSAGSWLIAYDAFKDGKAHLIPNFGINDARMEYANFTVPMDTFKISLFARFEEKRFIKVDDLGPYLVGVVKKNIGERIVAKMKGVNVKVFDDFPQMYDALLNGSIDALLYPEGVVRRHAQNTDTIYKIKMIGGPLREIKRGIAVRKDLTKLHGILNQSLQEFIKTSEFDSIYRKWFEEKPSRSNFISKYWWTGYAIFGVLILLFALFYIGRKRENNRA